jgi:DnaJ like chaperone protein
MDRRGGRAGQFSPPARLNFPVPRARRLHDTTKTHVAHKKRRVVEYDKCFGDFFGCGKMYAGQKRLGHRWEFNTSIIIPFAYPFTGVLLFKIIGALIGFYFLGFLGAIIGYFLGGAVDRYNAYGTGAINPLSSAQRQTVFIETLFTLKGKLAKVDGHISKDEIDHVEQFIQKMGMSAEHRQQAIDLFKRGVAPDFDYGPQLKQFMQVCGNTHSLKQTLLVYLIVMALADGRIDSAEERLLIDIAQHLGYDEAAFRHLLEMVLNQSHFADGQATSASALDDAYKALGVSKESSDQEVKRAYRKLMSQYHPDKLMGQGLPEDMIALATKQAQEVQVAYDLITKSRQQ